MSYSDSSVVSNGQLSVVFKNCPALSQLKGFSFPPATVGVRHVRAGCELGGRSGGGGGLGPHQAAPRPLASVRAVTVQAAPFPPSSLSRGKFFPVVLQPAEASGQAGAAGLWAVYPRGRGGDAPPRRGAAQSTGGGQRRAHAQPAQPGSRLPPPAGICTFVCKVVGWFLKSS